MASAATFFERVKVRMTHNERDFEGKENSMAADVKDAVLRHVVGQIRLLGRLIEITDVKETDRRFLGDRRSIGCNIQTISKACGIAANVKQGFLQPRLTRRYLDEIRDSADPQESEAADHDRIIFDHLRTTCSSLDHLIQAADIRPGDLECDWHRMNLESEMRDFCEKCGIPATFSTKYPDPEPLTVADLNEIGFLPERRRARPRRQT